MFQLSNDFTVVHPPRTFFVSWSRFISRPVYHIRHAEALQPVLLASQSTRDSCVLCSCTFSFVFIIDFNHFDSNTLCVRVIVWNVSIPWSHAEPVSYPLLTLLGYWNPIEFIYGMPANVTLAKAFPLNITAIATNAHSLIFSHLRNSTIEN